MATSIYIADDKVIKLEEGPGGSQTWILMEDDDGEFEWAEIKNRAEESNDA